MNPCSNFLESTADLCGFVVLWFLMFLNTVGRRLNCFYEELYLAEDVVCKYRVGTWLFRKRSHEVLMLAYAYSAL